VLADARFLVFLTCLSLALVLAGARSPTFLASVPFALVIADAPSPALKSLHLFLWRWGSQMLDPLSSRTAGGNSTKFLEFQRNSCHSLAGSADWQSDC